MNNNIIFLGCTQNYGHQFSAANTKVEFLAKGLTEIGDNCIIHNGLIGSRVVAQKESRQVEGVGEVLTYPKKGNQFISWIRNIPSLINDFKYCKKNGDNFVILSVADYHIYLTYIILARIFKYKVIVISHEWATTISSVHWLRKPVMRLYAATFGYFADAILPISEYIIRRIAHFRKPYLKIPITAEYNDFHHCSVPEKSDYFLYCVFAAYKRVIMQIIDAYVEFVARSKSNVKLVLVLSGTQSQISPIVSYIGERVRQEKIIIKTKVPYAELMSLYSNALALVVPLDPNCEQDEARFSQKIAEYLASGTPVISNNVGEIKYYFKDKDNIILCDYSVEGYVDAFDWVNNHFEEAEKIGERGFEVGKREFDYRKISKELHDFLKKV